MKSVKYLSLILVLVLASSCQKTPIYPDYPIITFKSFTSYGPDSAHIVLNFTDGNGQIGNGTNNDLTGPPTIFYQWMMDTNNSGHFIPYYSIVGKNDTNWAIQNYDIPSLTPTGKDKGISGLIQVKLGESPLVPPPTNAWYRPFMKGYTIEFRIWVIDRNGIKSNIVTTTPFTVPN